MSISEGWNRVRSAVKEIANQVALTILCIAALLTLDFVLLGIGVALEILYLAWAFQSRRYQARFVAREGKDSVEFLDRVLLVVTVAGFVVILFFGFCKHFLSRLFPYLSHAQGWEVGAIGWTTLFLVYYLAKFKFKDSENDGKVGNKAGIHNMILEILVFFYSALLFLAWFTKGEPLQHVAVIFGIGLCFCIIDGVSMKKHPDPKEQRLSRSSLYWADIPMVGSIFVLFLYLWMHRDTENPEVFVSGVVSCQLLISNAVFIVMEFDLLRPPQAPSGPEPHHEAVPAGS